MISTEAYIMRHTGKKILPATSIHMRNWGSWYKGNVRNFHNYRIFNGTTYVDVEMKSMQMAKYFCETWANLLLNEKCDIVIPEAGKEKFDKVLDNTNFWLKANNGIEKTFALSIGALVVSVENLLIGNMQSIDKDKAEIHINFVDGYKIRPITVRNGVVTECAFESEGTNGTTVVIHVLENEKYVIHNYFINKDKSEQYYKFDTKSDNPFFFIMQPNIANNLNDDLITDELGISIFANTIDGLKDLDRKYDSFYVEGVLGRKRIFLSDKAWKIDVISGEKVKTFDPMETGFYYTADNEEGKPHVQTKSDDLRYDSQVLGLNTQLNYCAMKCGLGQNFFNFTGGSVMTATQVVSENSDLYRNVRKHEILLENLLFKLTKTVIYASNTFTNEPIGEVADEDITIQFDDSIIEDKGAEMLRDKTDVSEGLMSRVEYRVKWYGEDSDTATANVREYFLNEIIDDYLPALTQGGMTPTQFVLKVYGTDDAETIEYITKAIAEGTMDDFGLSEE